MKNKLFLILPFTALLALAACNESGREAQHSFNAAGNNLGNGNVSRGANDVGRGFSEGANATGQAISSTARKIGDSFH